MSLFLEVKTLGIPEVQSLLSQIDHELKQGLRGRLKEAAGIVAEEMKGRTNSRRVAGAISFDVRVNSLIDFEARVGPLRRRAFFAHFLEEGTKAHTITNFFGRPGVAVQHPGARAHPFAEPALEATEERVVDLVGFPPVLQ